MFDLVERLSTNKNNEHKLSNKLETILFYQTEECRSLINESFRFDGRDEPKSVKNRDEELRQIDLLNSPDVVFIELNASKDVVQDAQRIVHLLPSHVSVVVIGSEDAISTIRLLKDMGFYYLFWPVSKQECCDFMLNVFDNHDQNKGLMANRKAKRVAILGVKGGVGTSLICSEISRSLSFDKGVSTLLVDHHYHGGNLDIFMGLKQYQKRIVQKGTLLTNIDGTYALGLIRKITPMLSMLAIDSEELNAQELKEYTLAVQDQVLNNSSVMIEDHAQLIRNKDDIDRLLQRVDVLVFVFDATVSALRDYNRFNQLVKKNNLDNETRVISVLNASRPVNSGSVSLDEIEKYSGQRPTIIIPYDDKAPQHILEGGQIIKTKSPMGLPLMNLVSLILGEEQKQQKRSIFRFFKVKGE
ncbi:MULTISPECIES: chromosome partitioning ATPase [Aliivibrio]|jgi:pilus assembly protein CpaE|uniref:Chromosome partitioning protein ParA n=1 Tax=Aliivibrio logei 5S-186 TaxID=626086 RepID=A0ABX3AX50_ALILO|nr:MULTISPECIES: chromosome partitioning ATPase [Aliivibrio]MBB1314736.1 chromosome partitioning protein ParA [Aliivibrio sp. SR45-2]OEF15885.1 chromosome partitioning protein ParA [Aliivibrio logei 5S-186]